MNMFGMVCSAVLAQTSDIAELLTDYQIDLLRALEMSRLQFLREIGSLRPGTSERYGSNCSSTTTTTTTTTNVVITVPLMQ